MSKKLLMNTNLTEQDSYRRYYQEYEGTFITATDKSEDDTIDTDRFIEVTEIFGNTIQDENNLEDIQSVGELYVDDEENPILDDLGREQYKIEISSCNDNINTSSLILGWLDNNGNVSPSHSDLVTSDFVYVKKNSTIWLKLKNNNSNFFVCEYDCNYNFIKKSFVIMNNYPCYELSENTTFIKVMIQINSDIEEKLQISYYYNGSYFDRCENKTTILLPCQLQKVGDVYDRLYWDSEKGKYVVEKNDTQLIETNITEKIQLPCYSEETHIFVNNTLDTTMKVLVPYKGKELSPVRYGLICWLDGRDGNNGDTVWKDKSGNGNDAKLQGFLNNGTDGFVNGKIVTKVPCNISMNKIDASEITIFVSYKLYNLNQLQGNYAPRIFRFGTLAYDLYISKTSGYGLYSISKNYVSNIIPTLNTVLTNTLTVDSLGNATLYKDNELIIKENKLIDLNDLSYLLLICDSGGFNGELYSVLIYNRALTEEEIQQNYLYEQSIKRGE